MVDNVGRRKIPMVCAFTEFTGNLEDKAKLPEVKNCTRHQVIKNLVDVKWSWTSKEQEEL